MQLMLVFCLKRVGAFGNTQAQFSISNGANAQRFELPSQFSRALTQYVNADGWYPTYTLIKHPRLLVGISMPLLHKHGIKSRFCIKKLIPAKSMHADNQLIALLLNKKFFAIKAILFR